ncbi:hypothetical protein A4A49_09380 [Nicotiana attenuata]|uniref:Uncharacterized protein n=1 Tax=Nicotiana attenuata TaxID=49451 RepID=A0A1J6J4R1_NICAT|nr:hypothetical protein A4A49_09380 [Nicotiana attenuata]
MKGHLKENCYKLFGYPQDFKGRKKFVANNVIGNSDLNKRTPSVDEESSLGHTAHDRGRLQDHEVLDYEVYDEAYSVDTHKNSENSVDSEAHDEAVDDVVNNNFEPAEDTHVVTEGEAALAPTLTEATPAPALTDTPTNITEGIMEPNHTTQNLRKSGRTAKAPLWLQDFVTMDYEVYEEAYSVDIHENSENSAVSESHDEPVDNVVNNNSEPVEDTHAVTEVDYEVYEEAYSVDTHENSENSADSEAHDEPVDDVINNNSEPAEDTHAVTEGEATLAPTLTEATPSPALTGIPTNITEGIMELDHTTQTLRKSGRTAKAPLWLEDFVTTLIHFD